MPIMRIEDVPAGTHVRFYCHGTDDHQVGVKVAQDGAYACDYTVAFVDPPYWRLSPGEWTYRTDGLWLLYPWDEVEVLQQAPATAEPRAIYEEADFGRMVRCQVFDETIGARVVGGNTSTFLVGQDGHYLYTDSIEYIGERLTREEMAAMAPIQGTRNPAHAGRRALVLDTYNNLLSLLHGDFPWPRTTRFIRWLPDCTQEELHAISDGALPRPELWVYREAVRFDRRKYQLPVWAMEDWALESLGVYFPHVSSDDPEQIAYTPSPEHGQRDRQVRTRPGRYLAKIHPTLGEQGVKDWANAHAEKYGKITLKFATTPDEIEEVYLNGPSSCMSKDNRWYESSIHPTRVYGAGDLAIAYYKSGGSIPERAICWPEHKIYGRIYGESGKLRTALETEGYRQDGYGFEGARVLRIKERGGFVVPYLDHVGSFEDDGDYLVISSDGDIPGDCTRGLATTQPEHSCCCCGCGLDEDEVYCFDDGDSNYCESCFDEISVRCEHSDRLILREDSFTTEDGFTIDERYRDECFECILTEELYYDDDNVYETDDGRHVGREIADRLGWHNADGVVYPHELLSDFPDAPVVAREPQVGDFYWVEDRLYQRVTYRERVQILPELGEMEYVNRWNTPRLVIDLEALKAQLERSDEHQLPLPLEAA